MFLNFFLQKKKPLPEYLATIQKELKKKNKTASPIVQLAAHEERVVTEIRNRTSGLNKNNVTRTQAYLDFYLRFPEIHWAFLGHMVSRNGGWNMTDLKGGLVSRLLGKKEALAFFTFLERANWLIFQDAYPQFLLYEESRNRGKNLFHLLPHFHVSTFMETIWNFFWEKKDLYTLTVGLIINEQTYLETRVLQNSAFQEKVIHTLQFQLHDLLSMNHILFPYVENGTVRFVGQTLRHFESLETRIVFGKRIYALLFENAERLKRIKQWATATPHTGSRKDYWPHLFNDIEELTPEIQLIPRIWSCQLAPGAAKIYSPRLESAWQNQQHPPAETGDWFHDWKIIDALIPLEEKVEGDIKYDYCKTLERIELAALAKKAVLFRNPDDDPRDDVRIITRHLS
ncbi:DUF2515 domain-containing protein [Neobacillus notoginsengisoli]|uniref:DUF2515 domain-containing protein n=1 Tax=Neobacillus notoginsengisoli TaxID=1578198 RepID=A0A417YY99_9BACI|nr:DUF2515 domain-containing protein [Neobacillus notoginsengisoli]RHW42748.1 DUF2515 domain-containing protein [Neobacillus notoginsengisoli]